MMARWFVRVCAVVVVVMLSSSAFAATRTWTGTNSALWSDPANWGGAVPVAGDDLVFPAGALHRNPCSNDLPGGTDFNSITFTGTGYTIDGTAIVLGSGGIIQNLVSSGTNGMLVNLTLVATRTISSVGAGGGLLFLHGVISGAGGVTVNGNLSAQSTVELEGANTYSGGTSLNDTFVAVKNDNAFGTGPVTTNAATTITMYGHTVANALSVVGIGQGNNAAVNRTGTWAGPVTLTGPVWFGGLSYPLTFSGPITGSFFLTAPKGIADSVVVLSHDSPGFTGTLATATGTLLVDAQFPNAPANLAGAVAGSALGGTGRIGGAVNIVSNTHLAPGHGGPGVLGTGNLSLQSGSIFDVELNGLVAGSLYDQANVTGTVTLGGTLHLSLGFVPAFGAAFTIINNDGADAVSGTFAGLPEGADFVVAGKIFHITYVGGSGNDVVVIAGATRTSYDFNGDFKTDRTVYRPSNGTWYTALSGGGATATGWGTTNDVDVPADYDGDGKADIAVWRPSSGTWLVVYSSDSSVHITPWGITGDVPLAGDADGDGKADLVVFRPSTGVWFFNKSAGGTSTIGWGVSGDQPIVGDFDHDGKMDAAVYRPSTGVWYVSRSSGGSMVTGWGTVGDTPVAGDWDGDGTSDLAVFRPSAGTWFVSISSGGTLVVTWGTSGDIPVSGDWDGDGKSDFSVWRPSDGGWFTQLSGGGTVMVGWGQNGDKPAGRAAGT